MNINEVEKRTPLLIAQLVVVWEQAVTATHSFLSDEEIKAIKHYIPQALAHISHLIIAENSDHLPVACMGIDEHHLEMLFITPKESGQGLGKAMIRYGLEMYAISEVAVNEQNPLAKGFYERMGFRTYKRTDHDEQGNAYPLLYMRFVKSR